MLQNKKVVFIIEGGERLGFGHFTRTTQVARYLVENKNCDSVFITNNSFLCEKIEQLGFKSFLVESINETKKDSKEICQIVKSQACRSVVIDIKGDHNPAYVIGLLKKDNKNTSITLVDNFTSARLLADKNLYPVPEQLVSRLNWEGYKGRIYAGLKFFPLKEEIINLTKTKKQKDCVVIMIGASDPYNLTPTIMKSLVDMDRKVKIIIGPGFIHKSEIHEIAHNYDNVFELYDNTPNYMKIAASSSLAVTALGISIYELAYLRIPVLVIANYRSDLDVGRILEKSGYCIFLGYFEDLTPDNLKKVLSTVDMEKYANITPDRHGTQRASNVILS